MNLKFDILIIGWGSFIQRRVFPALEAMEKVRSISVASKHQRSIDSKKICSVYSNYFEAIRKFDGEIIYISATNQEHDILLEAALQTNKHVIIDKPAILERETLNLLRQRKKRQAAVVEAVYFKHHPAWKKLRAIIEKKEEPKLIKSSFLIPHLSADNFRNKDSSIAGAIADMAVYAFSCGKEFWDASPINILASQSLSLNGVNENFCSIFDYGSGKKAISSFGFGYEYDHSIQLYGENYKVLLERPFSLPNNVLSEVRIIEEGIETVHKIKPSDSCAIFFDNFFSKLQVGNYSAWLSEIIDNYENMNRLSEELK